MASLTLDWLHVIALLGAVQGVLLAGALAGKRTNRTANRLLAATMLAFSVYLATTAYHGAGFERVFPHFFGAAYPLPFLFGPLVYLYAVSAADRSRRLTWRDALHFVPVLSVVVAGLPIYMMSGADKIAFYEQIRNGEVSDVPLLLRMLDPLKFVSGVAYTTATMAFLRRHREQVKESYSTVERVNLQWLLWLGGGAAAVWSLAVAFQVVESAGGVRVERADDFISLGIAVLVYGIGYMGLRQPEVFRYETAEHRVPAELRVLGTGRVPDERPTSAELRLSADRPVRAQLHAAEAEPAGPRYERSGLTEGEAERLRDRLTAVMDTERPWQDSDLTLADLAERLDTTPHRLSEVLNSQLGQTFYDFVNGYRVREVQRRIAAGDARKVNMLSLALDAGFASKSTFNLVFKKYTSQTPSDYRKAAGM